MSRQNFDKRNGALLRASDYLIGMLEAERYFVVVVIP